MSPDISFPITHLKCDDRGIFAVGCDSDVLVLGLLLVKGYLHERMGGRNGKRGRKEREMAATAFMYLLYCLILEVRGGGGGVRG